jgi:hypothetical protein
VDNSVIARIGASDYIYSTYNSLIREDAIIIVIGMQALSLVGFEG